MIRMAMITSVLILIDNFDLINKNTNELIVIMIEGSLEVKLPTIWTVEKQR